MAVRSGDSALQKRRVGRSCKQIRVVIGFQQQCIAVCDVRQNMGCCVAQVSSNTQLPRPVAAAQLHRLTGVMRHGKWDGFEAAQINAITISHQFEQASKYRAANACMRAAAHPQWHLVALCKLHCRADVVGVLVGDEDRVNVAARKPCAHQALRKLPGPETAIHQKAPNLATLAAFHYGGVARTAATEVTKTQGRRSPESGLSQAARCYAAHSKTVI